MEGDCLKSEVTQFADLRRRVLDKKEAGGVLEKGVDTPMYTMSSQISLNVTKYYEKKCLLIIIKNKKNSSKQVIRITYTFFGAATFLKVCEWFLFRQSKKVYGVLCSV